VTLGNEENHMIKMIVRRSRSVQEEGKMKKIITGAGIALFLACFFVQNVRGAELEVLKAAFAEKQKGFDKAANEVLDALDALRENEKDMRMKAEITMLRFVLKKNNAWAGRIDTFGLSSLNLDPYNARNNSEFLKTLTKNEKIAVQLKVPAELIRSILALAGTSGLEEVLDKCYFCPEAAQAKETLQGGQKEFPAAEKDNPEQPFPDSDPQHKVLAELVKKNQAALRALYETGDALKEKILRLRPAAGFSYADASLARFKEKMEELYKIKPEYRTQKAYALEEAETVAKISGLPQDDLCKYQSYHGTMGLRALTFSVPDVQFKSWLEVFFTMNGL
jgi:hypothetical protein